MKARFLAPALLAILSLPLPAQQKIEDVRNLRGSSIEALKAAKVDIPNRTAFVMLNPDYQVTPGDTYTIHYLYSLKPTTLPFFVEADYTANLSFFGKIRVKGWSYGELRVQVEKLVLRAYPDSLPHLAIDSVGAFPVLVRGEVKAPGYAQAWGFSRLTDVLADRLTAYASIRDIEVIGETGASQRFDLYQAALTTDLTKNPILHPGDTVVVHRLQREVFVKGEVYRQGAFQILPGENLRTVLEQYAGGLTNLANSGNAYILRLLDADAATDTVYLDLSAADYGDLELRDMDVLVVPGRIETLPLVFFEGALFMKPGTASLVSTVLPWPITQDQRISTALASLPAGALTPVSDLERSFVIRKAGGATVPVDLYQIVYNHDLSGDLTLQEGDRIVIPTRFYSVVVGGGVTTPGPQPYIAGKTFLEYIQLAGGFDPELATGKGIRIVDRDGKRHKVDRVIQPEDKIYVPKNNPLYVFNRQIGPVLTTLAAVVALALNINDIVSALRPAQ